MRKNQKLFSDVWRCRAGLAVGGAALCALAASASAWEVRKVQAISVVGSNDMIVGHFYSFRVSAGPGEKISDFHICVGTMTEAQFADLTVEPEGGVGDYDVEFGNHGAGENWSESVTFVPDPKKPGTGNVYLNWFTADATESIQAGESDLFNVTLRRAKFRTGSPEYIATMDGNENPATGRIGMPKIGPRGPVLRLAGLGCRLPDTTCTFTTSAICADLGGTPDNNCATGACCDGGCEDTYDGDCDPDYSHFRGIGSSCDSATCPRFSFLALADFPGAITVSASDHCKAEVAGSDLIYVTGKATLIDGDAPIVWKVENGVAGNPVQLPADPNCPDCDTRGAALTCACGPEGCHVGGHVLTGGSGLPVPCKWTVDPPSVTFTPELPALPPDYFGGSMHWMGYFGPDLTAIGSATHISGPIDGIAWRFPFGGGNVLIGPMPGHGWGTQANGLLTLPSPKPEIDVQRIAGGVIPESGGTVNIMPCVWDEVPDGTFTFTLTELPVPPGTVSGTVTALSSMPEIDRGFGYLIPDPPALQAVSFSKVAGTWNSPEYLPTLDLLPHARPNRLTLGTGTCGECVNVVGTSYDAYPLGGEIAIGHATLWLVQPNQTMTVFNLNSLTTNLPPGVQLAEGSSILLSDDTTQEPYNFTVVGTYEMVEGAFFGQVSDMKSARTARRGRGALGTPVSNLGPGFGAHAYLLTPVPPSCGPCRLYADVVPDCVVELADVLHMLAGYADPLSYPETDVAPCGGDGLTELADILALLNAYAGTYLCPHPCPP